MAGHDDLAGTWDEMVVVGQVARSQGRRGEVVINPETDFPERRFEPGGTVYAGGPTEPRAMTVAEARIHLGRPVVRFEGMTSIGEAETLTGLELRVPVTAQHALPDGSYYVRELVGCEVRTVDGATVGTVVDVEEAGGAARLVVEGGTEGERVDIPLAEAICVEVDLAGRRVQIDPPEGLLELNRRA